MIRVIVRLTVMLGPASHRVHVVGVVMVRGRGQGPCGGLTHQDFLSGLTPPIGKTWLLLVRSEGREPAGPVLVLMLFRVHRLIFRESKGV